MKLSWKFFVRWKLLVAQRNASVVGRRKNVSLKNILIEKFTPVDEEKFLITLIESFLSKGSNQ